jgi:hypothetical protein
MSKPKKKPKKNTHFTGWNKDTLVLKTKDSYEWTKYGKARPQ